MEGLVFMYTEKLLEAVEMAIADLQAGKRVVSVQYGDTRIQYESINLDDLLELRTKIKASLSGSSSKRQVIFTTSKGVR